MEVYESLGLALMMVSAALPAVMEIERGVSEICRKYAPAKPRRIATHEGVDELFRIPDRCGELLDRIAQMDKSPIPATPRELITIMGGNH